MRTAPIPLARLVALLGATLLAGCSVSSERGGSIGEQLGISAGSPDEFLIIARAPLELPPSFTLPTPQPGAPSRLEPNPFVEAETALFGRAGAGAGGGGAATPGSGELALLTGAGAVDDNSAIRADLDAAAVNPTGQRRFGLTSVFGMPIPQNLGETDEILVSPEENERLRTQGLPTPAAPPYTEDAASDYERRMALDGSIYRRR